MSDNRCPECGYGQQTSHGDGQVECRRCGYLWQRTDNRYTPTEAEVPFPLPEPPYFDEVGNEVEG